ncbi:Phosphatidate cytidylyltransferase [Minicystis rosea]|nr:Phosphatidate cytidylyltransferase [Minicystis rosea]
MAQSNLVSRLITGFIGAPLICALLYLGPAWGWLVFVSVAAAVGAIELFGMTHPGDRVSQIIGAALTLAVIGTLWFFGTDAKVLVTLLIALPIVGMMLVLWRLGDIQTAAVRVMANTFGPLYVGGGLGTVVLLRRDANIGSPYDGASFVVLALTIAWLSDTGAYFAGRFLGKRKLYEAVSPKKTVAGAIGGLAGSLVGAVFIQVVFLHSIPLAHAAILALVAGALGQAGDLGESLIKRSFGVKDSGGIVPGHGGILDRVDALLVTSTMTYLYVLWTRI